MKKMNTKGHVNCVVERKVANQIIASEPKMVSNFISVQFLFRTYTDFKNKLKTLAKNIYKF
jgi:hypothetical protein